MSRSIFSFRAAPFMAALAVFAVAALASNLASAESADNTTTLEGEYYWTGGNTGGDLQAVFTPTGDGTWDVDFHFDFRSKPHTYSGTAEGSLDGGPLSGKVKNENKRRTFTFGGEVVDDVFKGEHAEITAGERRTGTLELRR